MNQQNCSSQIAFVVFAYSIKCAMHSSMPGYLSLAHDAAFQVHNLYIFDERANWFHHNGLYPSPKYALFLHANIGHTCSWIRLKASQAHNRWQLFCLAFSCAQSHNGTILQNFWSASNHLRIKSAFLYKALTPKRTRWTIKVSRINWSALANERGAKIPLYQTRIWSWCWMRLWNVYSSASFSFSEVQLCMTQFSTSLDSAVFQT